MNKTKRNNILFLVIIVLLVFPQTRKPIQVLLHKGIALVKPINVLDKTEREVLNDYDWNLKTEKGLNYNFSQVKGRVVVVNFWATWCAPCIAEMPSLQKLYDKYGNSVEFLFITSDPIEMVEAFKIKKDYSFPVYQILSNPPEELQTSSIPRTLIINKNRDILVDESGAVDWFSSNIQKEIDKLLE